MALPMNGSNKVQTFFELRDIIEVDDDKFTITFSMYFGVRWREPRLMSKNNTTRSYWHPIDLDFASSLWIPNIFIYDVKDFKVIHVLQKLAALYIVEEGELFLQQATHVTFLCRMRFERYPLDEHTCVFRVGSSSYNNIKMIFETSVIDYNQGTQNTILDYSVKISDLEMKEKTLVYGDMGNYSISGFNIHLKRHMAKYIWNYYFPSAIFVMVSWVSFLIPANVIAGRMGLLVTLFLVLANMFNSINITSPTVEGMTNIGTWMVSCIVFVFGALAEYAVMLYLKIQLDSTVERNSVVLDPRTMIMNKDNFDQWIIRLASKIPKNDDEIARLDKRFFFMFIFTFIVFNIIFWGRVSHWQ